MNAFDRLMLNFYRVLNSSWQKKIRESATLGIRTLAAMPITERFDEPVRALMSVLDVKLGTEFMMSVAAENKTYVERSLRLGIGDVSSDKRVRINIGLYGIDDQQLASRISEQNLFWIGKHWGDDISQDFRDALTTAMQDGYTRDELADLLASKFKDLGEKSSLYWQGLAEHTALRIREFGRLRGYEKAGARYYRLVNPMDERTSDICRALVSEDKLYPLDDAIGIVDALSMIDVNLDGLDEAREQIKALAPWVRDKDVEYDDAGNPVGVSGAHTPFPPFHWKCRTQTEIVI